MTKRKLSQIMTVIAIAALALTAFVPAGFAQSRLFQFTVPFDFYAGNMLMPAGVYSVSQQSSNNRATQIYDRSGHVTSILPIAGINKAIGNNRLVFNRYGSMTFLSEIQWANSETGFKVNESKLEKETRLSTSPVRVAVQPGQ